MNTFDDDIDHLKKQMAFFNSLAPAIKYDPLSRADKERIIARAKRDGIIANLIIWPLVVSGFLYFA